MIPLFLATLCLLFGSVFALALPSNPLRATAGIASQVAAAVLTLIAVVPALAGQPMLTAELAWSYPVDTIRLQVDGLGALFLAFSLPLTALGAIYARGYLQPYFASERNLGVHYALLNMVSLSYIIIYTVGNAMAFLLGWEVAAIAAWLLVIWDYRSNNVRFAGFNYLVSTHLGLLFLIAAFLTLYIDSHSFDFGSFGSHLRIPGAKRNITFLLLVASFAFKSAFFPFHTWLPRAHAAAPAHVSALMSGVIHKAGLYGILRFTLLMDTPDVWMGWFLIVFGLVSAVMGVMYTTVQRDLKRLLGYSSTENVGIVCLGFGLGYLGLSWHNTTLAVLGFTGGILHIVHHALFKCLLFYATGAIYRATHSVDLEKLGGLARRMPYTAATFLLGSIAIAGLPPLNGFVSEFLIYKGLFHSSITSAPTRGLFALAAMVLAFVGATSAFSMTRAFGLAFLGTPRDAAHHHPADPTASMRWPLVLLAASLFVFGLAPQIGLAMVAVPVEQLIALSGVPQHLAQQVTVPATVLRPMVLFSALLLVLIAALVAARRWFLPPPAPPHRTWGCGYTRSVPRAQYTGASFSAHLAHYYSVMMPNRRDQELPEGLFPTSAHLRTHAIDPVEYRMFEVLKEGKESLAHLAALAPRTPRIAFAVGLVVLIASIALALAGSGGRP
jgi:hydrogenase-4 component B